MGLAGEGARPTNSQATTMAASVRRDAELLCPLPR
jgi:hypothetical protein